jgi:tetratricopeptide (TPR) repeat protein
MYFIRMKLSIFFLPLAALFIQCSTYFNMFYNAESAFNEGYKIHAKAFRNFPDSIVVEPPADARAKYDRAIEKAAKVLEVFPKDKKWHDDAYFLLGKSYFYEKEMGTALRWFRQLRDEYPKSPFIPQSYVYLAEAYIVNDNLDKAEETLNFALERYPFLDKDQRLSLLLVEVAVRREGKSQAVTRIEQARLSARSEEKRLDLLLRAAELYMDLQQYDRAIVLLRNAPRSKKKSGQDYRIDCNLVSCYAAVDSLERALQLLSVMKTKRQYAPYGKEILFIKGTLLVRLGRVEEAILAFQQITGGKQADSVASRADTSRITGKAWYELGLLYQKRKGNYPEAEKCFTTVAERQVRDTAVNPKAEKRLKAMKNLREWRTALAAHDTAVMRHASPATWFFKIGELFYYELDEPDSAYRQFLSIVNDTSAMARDTAVPKALFAAAFIARRDFRDTLRSDSLCRLLIERFPGSDFIGSIREEMKSLTAPMKTRRELAAEAFRTAEKGYCAGGDNKSAVQAFYNIYREYTDLAIASKSLFVAAWLTDNELQKKKVAKALYEKICDRYPGSIYCTKEAQPRLKAVLDTLESLRRERRIAVRAAGTAGFIDTASGKHRGADTSGADSLKAAAPDSTPSANPRLGRYGRMMQPGPDSAAPYNPTLDPRARMMMPAPAPAQQDSSQMQLK